MEKMGTPRTRKMWTVDEEEALLAGILKHGTGKWKIILTDEEFAPRLVNRSNVDLKDKWRNICGNASSSALPTPQSSPNFYDHMELRSWYITMVLEALSSAKNSDGIDIDSVHSYIEQRSDATLPESFHQFLNHELARLVMCGKLERNGNLYKMKDDGHGHGHGHGPVDDDHENSNCEDLASYAAHQIVVAENQRYKAIEACKEAEEMSKLVEESMAMLRMAEELHETCLRDGFVLFRDDSANEHDLSGVASNDDDIPKED